jgi:hypothetical protein
MREEGEGALVRVVLPLAVEKGSAYFEFTVVYLAEALKRRIVGERCCVGCVSAPACGACSHIDYFAYVHKYIGREGAGVETIS